MRFKASIGYLADTGTKKGLGVFASRDIAAGEIVEIAPVILFGGRLEDIPDALSNSAFGWRAIGGETKFAICLGYGGMYNHANPANMIYSIAHERGMRFLASRDIRANEELTVNYNDTKGGTDSTEDI
ncbi:SET domain-containing protein-lysine N-methyltransferase [Arenimonas caeni]|uniref:SET domain-containing protein n=1 Tax=Arenimonas caeni TaxID=2058085 RepID=A0A2P6M668_9GAMM|nr:SET domain-containing protein-lysine N-methyltransferase [Arenimonas caeni]PRH81508.1 hypothetical protein C6N40_11870 [Arenimonas caeni]